jgi:hypothetical protein
MWLWASELNELGFRRRSEGYWRCERCFGLPGGAHLSLFSWGEQVLPGARFLVELTEFHVTFVVRQEHVHFYYHERLDNDWDPAGHTSAAELRRLGVDGAALRARADVVAASLIAALGGTFYRRGERRSPKSRG